MIDNVTNIAMKYPEW